WIDTIVTKGIMEGAMPGAQVFVAKAGVIVYHKAFGYHDETQARPVKTTDLYDIASITKIATTTLAAMRLYNEGQFDLNLPLSNYLKDTILPASYNHFNIFRVTPFELLAHQSGLNPSLSIMPYVDYLDSYQKIAAKSTLALDRAENYPEEIPQDELMLGEVNEVDPIPAFESVYPFSEEEAYHFFYTQSARGNKIARNMYLRKEFADSLMRSLKYTQGTGEKNYQYACLNMILMQMLIDSITGSNLDSYAKEKFFEPLGMKRTTYNPSEKFPLAQIVPSNYDSIWRRQLIHGTVHDPSAALMGGIAGNAGLFSTAGDLGILGQMLLNEGVYNGRRYFDREVVQLFTHSNEINHRGLGFDKPFEGGVHARDLSPDAFGHLGYTGTAIWIDPENEIVFVFLSNRTMPDSSNNKLSTMGIRQRVHQIVYEAIER
ncbi:MAG: serine hydrolase domain-containing protein, partial [Bacteroidota bacterium]